MILQKTSNCHKRKQQQCTLQPVVIYIKHDQGATESQPTTYDVGFVYCVMKKTVRTERTYLYNKCSPTQKKFTIFLIVVVPSTKIAFFKFMPSC